MADSTIPNLVAVTTPAPTDLFGVRQSGDTRDKKMTRAQIHTLQSGEILTVPSGVDLTLKLGDAAGANKLIVTDSADVDVFNINSTGEVSIGGVIPVAGTKLLLPQEDDAVTPTLAFGTGGVGIYSSSTAVMRFAVSGIQQFQLVSNEFRAANASGGSLWNKTASATVPGISPNGNEFVGIGGAAAEISMIIASDEGINIAEASDLITTKFDAGDNQAGNVGAWTSIKSAVATISSSAGATLTASGLIPAGSFLLGLSARITTGFGTSTGLTDFDVGDGSDVDRWANSLAITSGTTLDLTDATAAANGSFASANDVVLTAVGGNFDATGVIELIAHYMTLTAPTG